MNRPASQPARQPNSQSVTDSQLCSGLPLQMTLVAAGGAYFSPFRFFSMSSSRAVSTQHCPRQTHPRAHRSGGRSGRRRQLAWLSPLRLSKQRLPAEWEGGLVPPFTISSFSYFVAPVPARFPRGVHILRRRWSLDSVLRILPQRAPPTLSSWSLVLALALASLLST